MGTLGGGGGLGGAGNGGTATVGAQGQAMVMPGFPLRAAAVPHYSPYSPSRFHIDKRCQHRCSWKCFSIALILLAVALTAMLAYAGKPCLPPDSFIERYSTVICDSVEITPDMRFHADRRLLDGDNCAIYFLYRFERIHYVRIASLRSRELRVRGRRFKRS